MIINFSIENFGPIKEKQTLSFEADKSKYLEDYYVVEVGNLRLLKMALIYGANASGKTSILKALDFLRDLVLEPQEKKTETLNFNPFLFDPNAPEQNSKLSIEFIQNEIKYFYEIEFSKKAIVKEALFFYHPNKANIFRRTTNLDNQLTEISLGSKIKKDAIALKTLESNTLWNNTVLGGFLKTNIEWTELGEVTDWFKNYLQRSIHADVEINSFVASKLGSSKAFKFSVVNILRKADFNISDVLIEKEKIKTWNDSSSYKRKKQNSLDHIESDGLIEIINVSFEHTINDISYSLPFELESQGTQRYFGFAGLLSLLINASVAFPIDELESSLHPDLYIHFILSFINNAKQSQIIATTHNREILNNKDIFRDDVIWITDKSSASATELYSLADFDSSVIRDTTNRLNAYKSGKLGGVPNLGDAYITTD